MSKSIEKAFIGSFVLGAGISYWLSRKLRSLKPAKAKPINDFDKERYLGKWYEIARMDNKFEHNLSHTTAEYAINDAGKLMVLNMGYDDRKGRFRSALGEASFLETENLAALKVSFKKPFFSGYNILAIDKNYQYALVAGEHLSNLWLLSRKKTMPKTVKSNYLKLAKEVGYDVDQLIWVNH